MSPLGYATARTRVCSLFTPVVSSRVDNVLVGIAPDPIQPTFQFNNVLDVLRGRPLSDSY